MSTTQNVTQTATTKVTPNPASVRVFSPFKLKTGTGDFIDDLASQGYAVVKGAVPLDRARAYQQRAFDWLRSFDASLDLDDPSTWKTARLPVQTDKNTYEAYGVVHEKFMWDVRMEPGVIEPFAKIWGTPDLLVSFDSLNITLPGLKPVRAPWPHVDQAPRKRGMHCVQGIVNLSHAGPEDGSLAVVVGSNKHIEEYFDTQTKPADWEWRDNRYFNEQDMEWFRARGCEVRRVEAEPGDLVLWDSRTVHWGSEPTEKSKTIRTVVYAAYAPAVLASKEAVAEKQKVFATNGATTHWPHDNIKLRELFATLPDGTPDPRNRSEPLEKAERTDKLLKLAGLMAY
ncbi:hypothetical protein C8R45DRAFT_1036001 [Mycena sanguinolenta]|nr:hypothetical protein C8R45DRAFT_1036001 [Mycena sanguinolenta]